MVTFRELVERMDEGFNLKHVQSDFDKYTDWYQSVTSVNYTGDGEVIIKGKSKIRKDKDAHIYKGNAQLASNLAKGLADHYGLKEPKMISVSESREEAKAKYLEKEYDKKSLESLMKKGKVLVQYTDKKSRRGINSGKIISLDNKGVVVNNPYDEGEITVSFDKITFADNIK